MKLAVDGRMIALSGIGRYVREVLSRLPAYIPQLELTVVGNPDEVRGAMTEYGVTPSLRVRRFTAPIYSVREQFLGAALFKRLDADLLFFPHYNVPILLRRPQVVTVHDTTQLRFPETFGHARSHVGRYVMGQAVRQARHVLTDSEATRRDLETLFPAAAGKVTAAPLGVARAFRPAEPAELSDFRHRSRLPTCYILTVGNRKPHKNLEVAAEVIHRLRERCPEVAWVVVGKQFASNDAVTRCQARLPGAVVEIPHASDAELRLLYAGAAALLMPSHWEGFGLPAVEAMACGTAVVASTAPALAEVLGDAGPTHAPDDVEGFAHSLGSVLTNARYRAELVVRGRERARRFTWDSTAAIIARVISESVAGRQGNR